MDEEMLISLVEKYKELYDLQDPRYDDNLRRKNIWDEIGDAMQTSGELCRERWRRVRDNYRRAKKLRKTKSGQGAKNMKSPKYEKLLAFLTPYLENESETKSNLPPVDSLEEENDDSHSSRASSSALPVNPSLGILEESVKSGGTYIRRKPPSAVSSEPSSATNLFKEYLESKYKGQIKKTNPIVNFFTNLGETVSKFPENVQIQVKRDVFKIVSMAEENVCKMKEINKDSEIVFVHVQNNNQEGMISNIEGDNGNVQFEIVPPHEPEEEVLNYY